MIPTNTRRAVTIVAGALSLAAIAVPTPALATSPLPPSIASTFSPNLIGIGGTATLGFTITNPNTSSLSGISFTDTLPTGVVIDSQNGESGTCGTSTNPGVVTASPGSSTISLTNGSLKAGANCVVSVDVTSTRPGDYSNDTGPVSSTQGGASAGGDTESLTVVGNPTITASAPANNATFNFGQTVDASYTCTEAANGPGIIDCSASDNDGNSINSGSPLDTDVAGPNQLTISATSADGLVVFDTINYTVRPDNDFTVTKVKGHSNGQITLDVKVFGKGKLTIAGDATAGHFSRKGFDSFSDNVKVAKVLKITVKPDAAGRKLLKELTDPAKSSKSEKGKSHMTRPPTVTVALTISWTPTGGVKNTSKIKGVKFTP